MLREKIDSFHFEDLRNKQHPSIFFKHEDYDLFILRLPVYVENKELSYESFPFVITDSTYYFYDQEKKTFTDMEDINVFYKFLDAKVDNVLKIISDYINNIENVEDMMYQGKSVKTFNKDWYRDKTDIIRINRLLSKAMEVFSRLIATYKKEDDYLERNFEDINEHLQRATRSTEYLLEKLDSLYNFHLNQTNEQMNRIVYILTLLSGVFLPLNLIVGFFGMNTTSLPFTNEPSGTLKVVMVLSLSALIATLLTFFMRRR